MIRIIIKFWFTLLCSLYTYTKLLNIPIRKKTLVLWFPFAITGSVITCIIYIHAELFVFIATTILVTTFTYFVYKRPINTTLCFAIISIGISYISFVFAHIITSPINYAMFLRYKYSNPQIIITSLILGVFQYFFLYLLFRIKRFKNGLPFLEEKKLNDVGIFLCILLLLMASLFYVENGNLTLFTVLIFIVILCGVILILWWRSLITNSYLERLHKRDTERYEKTIEAQQQEIDNLKLHNDALAKIIHKDNKLIPAMELAVKDFLRTASTDDKELKDKASSLINQLESLSGERKGIIHKYETTNKTLPVTGVASTDAVMKYLLHRANESDTLFDLSVTGNIKYMTSDVISENDLNTLISDLGENALIATKELEKGRVLITLGVDDEHYCLKIYDNAAYFDVNVIRNLGKSRYTTRARTGGSGIGLMTTFELLRKYNASFEIDECISHEIFTKCVSVRFDSNSKLRIRSVREGIAEVFTTKYKLTTENTDDNNGYFETNITNTTLQ